MILTLLHIGRIRLSVSKVNRTYELSRISHVTPFRKYGKHSTGPSTYGLWVRTYSKLLSCKSVLTVCRYRAQSNEIWTYGRVSRGSPREFVGTACCRPNGTYGQSSATTPLHVCPNNPPTGLTTAMAPSGHQMAVVTWDRSIQWLSSSSSFSPVTSDFRVHCAYTARCWHVSQRP